MTRVDPVGSSGSDRQRETAWVVDRYVISVPPGAIIRDRCFSQEGQVIETRHT